MPGNRSKELRGTSPRVLTPTKRHGGFTLIEIVIALFVLITALLALISTTVIVVKSNTFSQTMTTATTLAKDKMEQLKNTAYASLTGGTDYAKPDSTVLTASTSETTYTRTWTVTNDGTPAAGMKTITVSVVWAWQGENHTVLISSIVAI